MPDAPAQLRDATAAELPALLALESAFPGDRMRARQLRHHLHNPRARLRVALLGGLVVGSSLLLVRAGSRRARLYSIAVHPDARGRGLGRQLLADAEACAQARGCTTLALEVRADNAAALALYRGAGYRVERLLAGYYEDGGDGVRLGRPLGGPAPGYG